MRIYDQSGDKALHEVILFLTMPEAKELLDALEQMVEDPSKHHHEHIDDREYAHEITVAIYDEGNLRGFDARSIRLIREDK